MTWVQVLADTEVFYSNQERTATLQEEKKSFVCLAKENKGRERELLCSTDMSRE